MRRRRVLQLVGASALPRSGCLERRRGEDGETETPTQRPTHSPTKTQTRSPTDSPTPTEPPPRRLSIGNTATFSDGESLTVGTTTVQQSIIVDAGAFLRVGRKKGHQYVVVTVGGSTEFEPSDFVLKLDGRISDPPNQRQYVKPVLRTCSATCIGLPIETNPSDTAAVVYRPDDRVRASWTLQAGTVDLFGVQPWCTLREASLTAHEGDVAVQFTVENGGHRKVGFRALVAPAEMADVSAPVGFWVPQGKTVTETFAPPELDGLAPENAKFTHPIKKGTRYFEVGST